MIDRAKVLVINLTFPEVDHLAAGLAEAGLLSRFVRPYANLGRHWERLLGRILFVGGIYSRSFGRRKMPESLRASRLVEAALFWDFVIAIHHRISFGSGWYRWVRNLLRRGFINAVARAGAGVLRDEQLVVSSWYCALPAFETAKARGITRVLNYPIAHHAFARRFLTEEAELEPDFSATLNGHNLSLSQMAELDREIELADYILVGSNFVKDSFVIEGVPEKKLRVIPYGADTTMFHPSAVARNTKEFNLIFVGQLSQRKGISYLLRAYEYIHDQYTSLTLVGSMQDDGTAIRPWRQMIRHVPHVPRTRLAEIFREADVFVFPTLIEGMPIAVLEAMASGIPVITTPNGPGDIVRDGVDGFIVPVRDEKAIVDRLEKLRADPDLRAEMGRNARQRAQEFTWSVYEDSVVGCLAELVTQSSEDPSNSTFS